MSARTGVARRAVGLFVPPRSTLRRGSDRLEVAARWVLLIAGLLLLPVALAAGAEVTARLAVTAANEQEERHPVIAEVLPAASRDLPAGGDVSSRPLHDGADPATDGETVYVAGMDGSVTAVRAR